jgi:hypothetical protein
MSSSSSSSSPSLPSGNIALSAEQAAAIEAEINRRTNYLVEQRVQQMQAANAAAVAAAPQAEQGDRIRRVLRLNPPPDFTGKDANATQGFIDTYRRYLFLQKHIPSSIDRGDEFCVEAVGYFLKATAATWFTSVQASDEPITDLEQFDTRLKARFLPIAAKKTARAELRRLVQSHHFKSATTWSQAYLEKLAAITDMSMADQIENYIEGLRFNDTLHLEVYKNDTLTDLHKVMDFACFIEARLACRGTYKPTYNNTFRNNGSSSFPTRSNGYNHVSSSSSAAASSSSAPMDLSNINVTQHAADGPQFHDDDTPTATINGVFNNNYSNKKLEPLSPEEREKLRREGKCFRCRQQGHLASTCPLNNRSKNVKAQ